MRDALGIALLVIVIGAIASFGSLELYRSYQQGQAYTSWCQNAGGHAITDHDPCLDLDGHVIHGGPR